MTKHIKLFDAFTTGFGVMGSDKGVKFSQEHTIQISGLRLLLTCTHLHSPSDKYFYVHGFVFMDLRTLALLF
jgi:hypothetical protein